MENCFNNEYKLFQLSLGCLMFSAGYRHLKDPVLAKNDHNKVSPLD